MGDRFSDLFASFTHRFRENVRFARSAIVAHKLRSLLTVLGIVIGVCTVIGMVSVIEGFNRNVIASFKSFGATLVQFQKYDPSFNDNRDEERRKDLTVEDAAALKKLCPSMAAVSPERYWPDTLPPVKVGAVEGMPDQVAGVTADYPAANNHFIGEGRFISESDVLHRRGVTVLGYELSKAVFGRRTAVGKQVVFEGRKYIVVGVMERQGQSMFESVDLHVYFPISTLDHHFPWIEKRQGVNIATIPKRPEWVERITEEGITVLRARRHVPFNKPNDFGILTPDTLVANFKAVTGGIALTMIAISSIALLVGGVGIMNIMLVSVTERTREIGVRLAIGAFERDVLTQFLVEAVVLSLFGGAIGISIALTVSALVARALGIPFMLDVRVIALAFLFSAAVGVIFGFFPARRAASLNPIDALRHE
ncbi:MAG TPA: ABC transporter permease [Vicinamibacterales bacterium]|nr:ABC transporter permease [Vicinamibacterales bacterium]